MFSRLPSPRGSLWPPMPTQRLKLFYLRSSEAEAGPKLRISPKVGGKNKCSTQGLAGRSRLRTLPSLPFVGARSLTPVCLSATPSTAACQAPQPFAISRSSLPQAGALSLLGQLRSCRLCGPAPHPHPTPCKEKKKVHASEVVTWQVCLL